MKSRALAGYLMFPMPTKMTWGLVLGLSRIALLVAMLGLVQTRQPEKNFLLWCRLPSARPKTFQRSCLPLITKKNNFEGPQRGCWVPYKVLLMPLRAPLCFQFYFLNILGTPRKQGLWSLF